MAINTISGYAGNTGLTAPGSLAEMLKKLLGKSKGCGGAAQSACGGGSPCGDGQCGGADGGQGGGGCEQCCQDCCQRCSDCGC